MKKVQNLTNRFASVVYDSFNIRKEESEFDAKLIRMDMKEYFQELKDKLHNTTGYADRVQILTLAPKQWSVNDCANYFNVSKNIVRKARSLGILEKPSPERVGQFHLRL